MEGLRRRVGSGSPAAAFGLVVFMCVALVMLPDVSATRYIVGANMGWTSNVNYTNWARGKHFYNGDWLCKLALSLSHTHILTHCFFPSSDPLCSSVASSAFCPHQLLVLHQ